MVEILMVSAKLATLGLLKIKVFWNKGHDFITSVQDVTNNILPRDSYYRCGNVTKVFGANSYICKSYRGKADWEDLLHTPRPILNAASVTRERMY